VTSFDETKILKMLIIPSFFLTGDTATTYHFKTMVPSVAAGAIIGKGGETIASLQKDAGARVKMSKSHDFYPGKKLLGKVVIRNEKISRKVTEFCSGRGCFLCWKILIEVWEKIKRCDMNTIL
jgi:hypothetical protein